MAVLEKLELSVETLLSTRFDERVGRVVPTTEDVAGGAAVALDATFLYADLAGSATLARQCPWDTTSKVIKAFLDISTRLILENGGHIRSFDGDRVMGIFIGDYKSTSAVKCARQIFYAVEHLLGPAALQKFTSVKNGNVKLKCGIGLDAGTARAVRGGVRANNDLIWIGRAPSMAAKLSDIRDYPRCVYIHSDVFNVLSDKYKKNAGNEMWVQKNFKFAGENHTVFGTSFTLKPS